MEKYVGLDVSMEETSVCVLDGGGNVVFEGKTSSQPDALRKLLRAKASDAARIVLETGSLASWLWHELRGRNFPVICLDARHARAALSMRVNKTDSSVAQPKNNENQSVCDRFSIVYLLYWNFLTRLGKLLNTRLNFELGDGDARFWSAHGTSTTRLKKVEVPKNYVSLRKRLMENKPAAHGKENWL